jgi:hypothetical protein
MSEFKVGDILRLAPRRFVLVVFSECNPENGPSGFYYVPCRKSGEIVKRYGDRISAANYVNHSNMILVSAAGLEGLQLVGHIELEDRGREIDGRRYASWRTGDTAIDQYMGNLDDRWRAFLAHAPEEFRQAYAANEDRNYHSENGQLVTAWFDGSLRPFFRRSPILEGRVS